MGRFLTPFALDLRSLALLRILLGGLILYDLLGRFPYIELFLSDAGAFSRAQHLAGVDRPWSFSVYMMFGDADQIRALFGLHALAALSFVLGFRVRWSGWICWALLVSLQHRNSLVLNGGDTLFAVLCFWAMFLPLGARWSLDAVLARRRKGAGERNDERGNAYLAVPGAAFILQVCLMYWFTVYLKSGPLWREGEAVAYALGNAGLAKPAGVWLSQHVEALAWLTRLSFHWEWLGCLIALSPWGSARARLVAVGGFLLFHGGLAATMDLALFPAVCIAAWLAFLPGAFWEEASRRAPAEVRAIGARVGEALSRHWPLAGGETRPYGKWASWVCGALLVSVLAWNVRGLPGSWLRPHFPQPVETAMQVTKLRQKWSMFAPNPPRHGRWYALEAQMANGDSIDLFFPSVPFTLERPAVFTERLPDRRWGKFLNNLGKSRYRSLRRPFVAYLTDRWNERMPDPAYKIERATLLSFRERIQPGGEPGRPTTARLTTYRPSGVRHVVAPLPSEAADEEGDGVETEDL